VHLIKEHLNAINSQQQQRKQHTATAIQHPGRASRQGDLGKKEEEGRRRLYPGR
jgi:hypothetical protein